jgi:hypothetical protein
MPDDLGLDEYLDAVADGTEGAKDALRKAIVQALDHAVNNGIVEGRRRATVQVIDAIRPALG